MEKNKRREKFIGTAIQKKLLFIIFASAAIPASTVVACLYYFISNLAECRFNLATSIGCDLVPELRNIKLIILIGLPVVFLLIWVIALELSHRIAGPLFRLEKELDQRIAGKCEGHIKLRARDELRTLVDKINKLINK